MHKYTVGLMGSFIDEMLNLFLIKKEVFVEKTRFSFTIY
jgi:hypothetical protein